ncbi:hypothetical protein C3L33_01184, partial [Rhododendron williamsianum]
MVERRKILNFSESSPQFCKVYVPDLSSHRLGIPRDFVKHFTGDLRYKSTITTPEKRSWHVELKEVDEHLYFQEGWQQFVHDNSLVFGDFLIFYYGGNAQFYTKIYGKNGCRKKGSLNDAQGANGDESAQKELCLTFSSAIQERTRKEASKFVSEFPFFEVVMRPSYINTGLMNVPSSFHRYMKDRHGATLVVSDRSWPVKLIKTRVKFCHGWSTFCRENTLKVDDVCVFELIEKNDVVLKVSIFRCPD